MTDNKKKTPQALAREILSKLPAAAAPAEAPPVPTGLEADALATDLIELYFTLEEPVERDVVFDKLAELESGVAEGFFAAMMVNDEDEYLRAAAAAHLARRGNTDAVAILEQDLAQPSELFFFGHAVGVLSELRGVAFYDSLQAIWRDSARDPGERREAMVGLEFLDAPRAMADFEAFIAAITDVQRMPDDEVEVAMAAFVRNGHVEGAPLLEALRQRILQATWEDADERKETAAFIQEGIELLRI